LWLRFAKFEKTQPRTHKTPLLRHLLQKDSRLTASHHLGWA
jgi:hypothetical protein